MSISMSKHYIPQSLCAIAIFEWKVTRHRKANKKTTEKKRSQEKEKDPLSKDKTVIEP